MPFSLNDEGERAATAKGYLAMRAAPRERMISITALVLVISIGFLVPKAAAQSDKYSKMAPVDQYLMERNAEILWRGAPLPIPYPATRRSWSWDGRAMKQLSEERMGLSVWWKEAEIVEQTYYRWRKEYGGLKVDQARTVPHR